MATDNTPIRFKNIARMWTDIKAYLVANYAPAGVHITETGTNSGWTYRKYSDGTCEAWFVKTDTNYAMTSAFATGGFYGPQLTQSFPFTFAATPYIQITSITPNMGWGMIASPTTTYTYYRAINRTSATGTIVTYFYIRGTLA